MTPYRKRVTPTTLRLMEGMEIRHLASATIDAYTYHLDKFDQFFGEKSIVDATTAVAVMGRSHKQRSEGPVGQNPTKLSVAEILKSRAPQSVQRYPRQAALTVLRN